MPEITPVSAVKVPEITVPVIHVPVPVIHIPVRAHSGTYSEMTVPVAMAAAVIPAVKVIKHTISHNNHSFLV
jgi:hypothetical protein